MINLLADPKTYAKKTARPSDSEREVRCDPEPKTGVSNL